MVPDNGTSTLRHRCALAIIDLVESVRLMQRDEPGVVARWQTWVRSAEHQVITPGGGRLVKSLGDGLLVEFETTLQAVRAAQALHALAHDQSAGHAPDLQFALRIGIHLAEVVRDTLDLFGHGVNLAARLASLAGPGQTVLSVEARDDVVAAEQLDLVDLGECFLKHIEQPVRAFRTGQASPPLPEPGPVAPGPSVALLPLRALNGDHDGTGAALDYELQALFCGAQALRVVSRLSVLPLMPLALSPPDLCRRLQVDYLVSGAWRLDAGRVQVFLEVTQGATGQLVGSARGRVAAEALCQGDDDGLRELGEQVLRSVFDAELRRCGGAALPTVASYALLQRGIGLMHRMSRPAAEDAESALQHLAQRHPRAATPKAWLARWHLVRIAQAWTADAGDESRRARFLLRQAIDTDPGNALALALDGLMDSFVERRLDPAEARYRQALDIDPNEPLAWMFLSALLAHRGLGAASLEAMQRAEALLPVDPTGFYRDGYGAWSRLAAGQPLAAMNLARRSMQANRHHLPTYVTLTAAAMLAGDARLAVETARGLLERRPEFRVGRYVDAFPGGKNHHALRLGDALLAAGVPA